MACSPHASRVQAQHAVMPPTSKHPRFGEAGPEVRWMKRGRWDRNRTCNLRFWRKRRRILRRLIPSRQSGEPRIQATFRLVPSERVCASCCQKCCQRAPFFSYSI